MAPTLNGGWERLRKEVHTRRRRIEKRMKRTRAELSDLWLRFDDEATACPACSSSRLALLDVVRVRADLTGRRLAFLTGCEDCGIIFCNPLPHDERLEAFYGDTGVWAQEHGEHAARLADAHERRRRKMKLHENRARVRKPPPLIAAIGEHVPIASPEPGAKAIDFGCGTGKILNWLQDYGWDTYGIEPSLDVAFLRHARLQAPPPDGTFGFAVLHHVLEHVPNPLEILRQLAASLREGGVLFISVPRLDTLPRHGDFHYCINGRNHIMAFTDACLTSLLALAGFEVIARLHDSELDEALTNGTPLRLRLLARRTSSPPAPPASPLAAARRALRGYAAAYGEGGRFPVPVPLRLKGGLMQRKLR